jgi:hypothetical protein
MLRNEKRYFPKADCTDCQLIFEACRKRYRATSLTKGWIVARQPDCSVGVEQDHLSASHSTSIGEMMSPAAVAKSAAMLNSAAALGSQHQR